MGWTEAKQAVLAALDQGLYLNEIRTSLGDKNLLASGEISPSEVRAILAKANGTHCRISQHHRDSSVSVYAVSHSGWYIKFYFVVPNTIFISVHR